VRAARFRPAFLICAGTCCCAAAPQDLLSRIREHLREYVSQLPDYTCRVTIERATRRSPKASFELTDRLRVEVAYSSGNELYAWPGAAAFERSIEDLLPAHGMVSNGSYALHMRTLFLRNVAQFGEPRPSGGQISLVYSVPAVRSGYALSTSAGSVPAGLEGTVWLDAGSLDLQRLEVRVETRLAQTAETTTYARAKVGDVQFVLPQTSALVLVDPNGVQLRNASRFDEYRRFAGTATVHYGPVEVASPKQAPRETVPDVEASGKATLDAAIGNDAAIGDSFVATTEAGTHVTGRITGMRRVGRGWQVELSLGGARRKTLRLPIAAGVKL